MTTAAEICRVFSAHPDLGVFGFGTLPPRPGGDFLRQVNTARRWLTNTPGASHLVERRGSYGIKHLVEQARGCYVTNGAAIVAAALEGFEPVRSKRPGPNCSFRRTT